MKKIIIGIDVSKIKNDVCVISGGKVMEEFTIDNTLQALRKWLAGLSGKVSDTGDVLVCAEHTGQYAYPLCCACKSAGIDLWVENPMQIKHSMGFVRGKGDKVDARRIAEYAVRFADKCRLYSLPEKSIASLQQLLSERDLLLTHLACYKAQLTDQKLYMADADYRAKARRLKPVMDKLQKAIDDIDGEVSDLIRKDEAMSRQYELLTSIDGVGERLATKMIAVTNAFRDFDSARKFCCHAGVVPFAYTSGSSVRSRFRVSQRADKSIKALLHMAALAAATRCRGELHDYYERKTGEGKNKMLVLNNVRAKLVLRMFAVIQQDRKYEKNYQFSLFLS